MTPPSIHILYPRPIVHLYHDLQSLIVGKLWLQVLLAMAAGLGLGVLLGPVGGVADPGVVKVLSAWLALPGRVFLALIQMVVITLVVASIMRGLAASESIEQLRKLGLWVGGYFVMTTLMAVTLGIVIASVIQPGHHMGQSALGELATVEVNGQAQAVMTFASLPEHIVKILPTNPLHSMAEGQMLHTVIMALIAGVALLMLPAQQAKPLLDLMGSLQAVSMTIVRWAMYMAPIAVFGLMAQLGMTTGLAALQGMGVYVLTVLLGLSALAAFYLFLIVTVGRLSPWRFLRKTREALLLAFSTSSSAAVMPITVKSAGAIGVRPSIAQFVIPMGTTINMDGTALYQVIAVLFLAQLFGVELGWSGILMVTAITVGASIGSPGTPGVGIAILAMTLESVGIPSAGVAMILAVDRFLDMCRTAVNVAGDLTAAVVMDRFVGSERSHAFETVEQAALEVRRAATGEDVIVKMETKGDGKVG